MKKPCPPVAARSPGAFRYDRGPRSRARIPQATNRTGRVRGVTRGRGADGDDPPRQRLVPLYLTRRSTLLFPPGILVVTSSGHPHPWRRRDEFDAEITVLAKAVLPGRYEQLEYPSSSAVCYILGAQADLLRNSVVNVASPWRSIYRLMARVLPG